MNTLAEWGDEEIETEINRLCSSIKLWAESHDLWYDSGFSAHMDRVDGEPTDLPTVTILHSEGGLRDVFCGEDGAGLQPEFTEKLDALGYWYECLDNVSVAIYPNDDNPFLSVFIDYFHWQWVCGLVKEDTADIYEELYLHFANHPDQLNRLDWRQFEVLLSRIFQNQGYKVLLGPGGNDGGIDLRLWQTDPIGDVLTLVQAKKKLPHNKIGLTEVAALHGIRDVEKAHNALFVTTSTYAPVAKKFAARTSGLLNLADKHEVITWCSNATKGILTDKSKLITESNLITLLNQSNNRVGSKIVHASWGYDMIINKFAIVVKESKYAALLVGLGNQTISHDGYGQRGLEVPSLDPTMATTLLKMENVWRAKRLVSGNEISYWDGKNLYFPWNGGPVGFDYMD